MTTCKETLVQVDLQQHLEERKGHPLDHTASVEQLPHIRLHIHVKSRYAPVHSSTAAILEDWQSNSDNQHNFPVRLHAASSTSDDANIFPAHAAVEDLITNSPYFAARLNHNNGFQAEQGINSMVISFSDHLPIPQEVLHNIVKSLYSGGIELSPENLQQVLFAADYMMIQPVLDACCSYLIGLVKDDAPEASWALQMLHQFSPRAAIAAMLCNNLHQNDWNSPILQNVLDDDIISVQDAEAVLQRKAATHGCICQTQMLDCIKNIRSKRMQLLHLVDFSQMHSKEAGAVASFSASVLCRGQPNTKSTPLAQKLNSISRTSSSTSTSNTSSTRTSISRTTSSTSSTLHDGATAAITTTPSSSSAFWQQVLADSRNAAGRAHITDPDNFQLQELDLSITKAEATKDPKGFRGCSTCGCGPALIRCRSKDDSYQWAVHLQGLPQQHNTKASSWSSANGKAKPVKPSDLTAATMHLHLYRNSATYWIRIGKEAGYFAFIVLCRQASADVPDADAAPMLCISTPSQGQMHIGPLSSLLGSSIGYKSLKSAVTVGVKLVRRDKWTATLSHW